MVNESCRKGIHCKCEPSSGRCCWCDDPATICPPLKSHFLKRVSIDELRAELAEREKREFQIKNTPPQLNLDPDLTDVIKYVEEIITHVREYGYAPKDYQHYVFDKIIHAMCMGDYLNNSTKHDFWKWWNWRLRGK